ncbi:hypothetical protein TALC_00182 [Thermoplasmatales archaeon BRNA1]|nr:hypothetical protein TALC_00182 [Thermoplasmatales archaeon BRNA1]
MSPDEVKELQDLRMEVISLRNEVKTLRDFVRGLYVMMNEGEDYEGVADFLGGAEFGRLNT